MAGHDLEVGVIVDLDIDRGSSPGGREHDRSRRANICEETVPVPRCLPLVLISSAIVSDEAQERDVTYHITDTLRCDRQDVGSQGASDQ